MDMSALILFNRFSRFAFRTSPGSSLPASEGVFQTSHGKPLAPQGF